MFKFYENFIPLKGINITNAFGEVLIKKTVSSFIFVLFIAIILSSSISFAEDDLNINRWTVDAKLLQTGDLNISEDISFDFNDDFNGVYRNISLEKIDSLEDLSIYEIVGGKEILYEEVESGKNGDKNKFTLDRSSKNLEVKIFSPSKDEIKIFRLTYTLKNVAIKHSDTGELYYKFLGKENDTPIDYFPIDLYLPKFDKNEIKIFAHGPANGKIYFSNEKIKSEISDIPANEFIENRVLFPREYIPLSENIGDENFDSIISEEKAFEDKLETDRRLREKKIFSQISIYLGGFIALIGILSFYKFRRNTDVFDMMKSPYPDNISPSELSLFMDKAISPRAFLASIFDLSFKGYIDIEDINREKKNFISEYTFTKINKDTKDLLASEQYLLDWLFNSIGDGETFSTFDLERYREKNYKDYYSSQSKWNNLVGADLKSRDYYDTKAKKLGLFMVFISILSFILGIIALAFRSLYGLLPLISSILLLVYTISLIYRTNDKGYIQYRLWKDFKESIKTFDERNIAIENDKSLIYAIALNMTMKNLEEYRSSVAHSYYPVGWGYLYFLTNKNGGSQFEDTFNNKFYGYSQTSTSNSSGFGMGGGFTGGGGSGAGGGGAGGF